MAFALVLRVYDLGATPAGLFCDEVAIGVNADSLGRTGVSLSGDLLPIYCHERSFEAWKSKGIVYQPIYTYATIPFVRLFGLSSFSLRLPSVFFALMGILGTYLLARRLFDARVALVAAALLAVSPWHHHFSRVAFEAISLTALLTFAFYFLHIGTEKGGYLLVGSGLLTLSSYAYPTAKIAAPLLLLGFVVIYRKRIREQWKYFLGALIIALLVALPNLYFLLADIHQERTRSFFIVTADLERSDAVKYLRTFDSEDGPVDLILESRTLLIPYVLVHNYLSYLSPSFLFLDGDPIRRHGVAGIGKCYLFYIPLLIVGFWGLVGRWKEEPRAFTLFWFVTFPLAASLTIRTSHSIRALNALPILEIIAAVGLLRILPQAAAWIHKSQSASWREGLGAALTAAVLFSALVEIPVYLTHYHGEYRVYAARDWQHGIEDAISKIKERKHEYARVRISRRVYNSFIYLIFYGEIDVEPGASARPLNAELEPYGYNIIWSTADTQIGEGELWLIRAEELGRLRTARILDEIRYPDGSPNMYLVADRDS